MCHEANRIDRGPPAYTPLKTSILSKFESHTVPRRSGFGLLLFHSDLFWNSTYFLHWSLYSCCSEWPNILSADRDHQGNGVWDLSRFGSYVSLLATWAMLRATFLSGRVIDCANSMSKISISEPMIRVFRWSRTILRQFLDFLII